MLDLLNKEIKNIGFSTTRSTNQKSKPVKSSAPNLDIQACHIAPQSTGQMAFPRHHIHGFRTDCKGC